MRFAKTLVLAAALGASTAGNVHTAASQDAYPSRPVRIIVGFGAGASADTTARVVAQKLSETLGQQFVVENKPGGGSNVATEFVSQAPKDGYTLLMGTVANTINSAITPDLKFSFTKDFTPIIPLVTLPNILVVHPDTGVSNVAELITFAKANPDKVLFASSGIGTSPHLSGELFNQMAGLKITHVPYKGSGQAVTDLLANRVQMMFSPAATVIGHVKEGKLKALATTQLQRAGVAPDLPTMSEAGLKGFDTGLWFGLMAPAGTPKDIIEKLNKATNAALKSPEVADTLKKQGMDILGGGSEEFARYIQTETDKWAGVARAAGLQKAN